MNEWDTAIKVQPKRQLVVTLDEQFQTAFIVEDGIVVSQGFSVQAERMETLQVGFLVHALARSETRKE